MAMRWWFGDLWWLWDHIFSFSWMYPICLCLFLTLLFLDSLRLNISHFSVLCLPEVMHCVVQLGCFSFLNLLLCITPLLLIFFVPYDFHSSNSGLELLYPSPLSASFFFTQCYATKRIESHGSVFAGWILLFHFYLRPHLLSICNFQIDLPASSWRSNFALSVYFWLLFFPYFFLKVTGK